MTLDQLVRRIAPEAYQAGRSNHFIYDPVTQAFETRVPRFGGKRLQFYEVTCSATATADATGAIFPVGVLDPAERVHVQIKVGYDAWVLPENARDVVRAVAGDAPGERLVRLLVEAVQRRALNEPGVLTDASPDRAIALARELERQVLHQHGLSVILSLQLDGSTIDLPRFDLDVPIQLADYPTAIATQVAIEACVHELDHARAIDAMKRRPNLEDAIRRTCRDFFLDVALQPFRDELYGSLLHGLRLRLEATLAAWFLRLRAVHLTARNTPPKPTEFLEVATTFDLPLRGYPRPVVLRTRVQLQLENEAIYHRAGAPALAAWAQTQVRPIVQQVLFDVRYSQLLLQSAQWEERILAQLRAAAAAVGYAVKAQVTTPAGPQRDYLSPQRVEVTGEFATAIDNVMSHLEIVLRVQLDTWQSVARELDRGDDLDAVFRDAVREEVVTYVHALQPIFLFTRFSDPKDHTGRPVERTGDDEDDRPSVEDAFCERITRALRSRFGLKVLAFTAKQGPSKIRDAYLTLTQAASIPFDVEAHLQGHSAPVMHHGAVQVDTVHPGGWPKFQSILPSPSTVTQIAAESMQSLLQECSTALDGGLPGDEIRALARDRLPKAIGRVLGLDVQLVAWRRDPSPDDPIIAALRQKALRIKLEAQLHQQLEGPLAELDALKNEARRLRKLGQLAALERTEQRIERLEARVQSDTRAGGVTLLPGGVTPPWLGSDTSARDAKALEAGAGTTDTPRPVSGDEASR